MGTVDELNIKITADVNGAAQGISQTAQELGKLDGAASSTSGNMSELVAAVSMIADSMSQLVQTISGSASGIAVLQASSDAAAGSLQNVGDRMEYINGAMQTANGSFDAAAASVSGLSQASQDSASALGEITAVAGGFGDRMNALQGSTAGTSESMEELRRGLSDVLGSMNGFSDSMTSAGADAENAAKRISELSERLDRMPNAQNVMSLASGFKYLKSIVGALGIGAFVKSSNDAYNVQMQNELKLTSHMKHRMNATEDQIQAIKDLASAQQQIGVIGDEIQLAGAQQLTTYARQASTLQTLIPAMNNLIAQNAGYEASVGDATSAADMLGRALNGQYTALKRQGVSFTEAQENVLKYGTEEQKAAVLADAINSKVGNLNELLAQTPTGKLKQLQNDFGDLQEQLGATFQPLISAVLPVARNVIESLAPPIMAFSTGIATIGEALAKLDSPATRAIAFTVAGLMALNKLKMALGGTAAGLLLIGSVITMIIGGMNKQEDAIGNTVSEAMNSAAGATDGATEAAKDYEDEIGEVEKAASRLAGFDTITKLSGGGSTGSLAAALIGDGDTSDIQDYASQAKDIMQEASDSVKGMGFFPEIDWRDVGAKIYEFTQAAWNSLFDFGKDLQALISGWGNDEAMYKPLKKWTNGIEDILNAVGLDGTGFVKFWQGIGDDIYQMMTGGDSSILKGFKEIDDAFRYMLGDFGKGWSDFWQSAGSGLYELTHKGEINDIEIMGKYQLKDFNDIIIAELKNGATDEEALDSAKQRYLNSSEALYWYNSLLTASQRTSALEVETWRMNLINSGQIDASAGLPPQSTSRSTAYSQARFIPTNVPASQIHVHVDVDGREIAQTVTDYQQEDNLMSGGVYGG